MPPRPPTAQEPDTLGAFSAQVGDRLDFLDDLLDRSRNAGDLAERLVGAMIRLGADAAWLGRAVDEHLIEPESWAGEQMGHYLARLDMHLDTGPAPSGPFDQAWRSGTLQVIDDLLGQPARLGQWLSHVRESGWRAHAAVPLRVSGKTRAVLNVYSRTPGLFGGGTWPLLLRHLNRAGSNAIQRIELGQRLADQQHYVTEIALRDPLTGLRNRVSLEDHIQTAMARARRQGRLLAIGMLDLDEFATINDAYGHSAGDCVLKVVAERLSETLRDTDGLFRYGGDEFVLLIESLDTVGALEGLLAGLERALQAPLDQSEGQLQVSASLGMVIYPFGQAEDNEPGTLLRQADQALYQLKRARRHRAGWWCLYEPAFASAQASVEPDINDEVPPYGPRAATLLASLAQTLDGPQARTWARRLYRQIVQRPDSRRLLGILSQAETERLLEVLESHATLLCDPALDGLSHREIALRAGHVHAILGVEFGALMESYDLMTRLLQRIGGANGKHSFALNALLERRVGLDVRWQVQAYHRLAEQRQDVLARIDSLAWETDRYADLAQGVVDTLLDLDEVVSATIGRPGADERFEFEFVAGKAFRRYLDALSHRQAAPITVDPQRGDGGGPTGRAWRSGHIERCLNYHTDPAMQPWRTVATRLGIRSSAAVPLSSPQGKPRAVLTLYCGLPGGYSAESQTHFLRHLQHTLGLALHGIEAREGQSHAVPHRARRLWRTLIEQGLEMHYQPVVNLHDGRFMKVEALARLRDGDTLLTPDRFLPTFTRDDLRALYEHGLDQALATRRQWQDHGLDLAMSINLPTSALTDPDYVAITDHLLRNHACPPHDLFLEILETDEPEDAGMRLHILGRFIELGVRLSEDDLGAGYSSLQRLSLMPFDIVKIDQLLVRGILNDPQRLLTFIRQLTRLGQDLGLRVAVEGLETAGLIEAATVLGADLGQGYAIGRPMPASAVREWASRREPLPYPAQQPQTALGVMAGFILWEEQMRTVTRQRELREHFVSLPCRLGPYIVENGLQDTELDRAHRRLHAVAAQEDPERSEEYRQIRELILGELARMIDR